MKIYSNILKYILIIVTFFSVNFIKSPLKDTLSSHYLKFTSLHLLILDIKLPEFNIIANVYHNAAYIIPHWFYDLLVSDTKTEFQLKEGFPWLPTLQCNLFWPCPWEDNANNQRGI